MLGLPIREGWTSRPAALRFGTNRSLRKSDGSRQDEALEMSDLGRVFGHDRVGVNRDQDRGACQFTAGLPALRPSAQTGYAER